MSAESSSFSVKRVYDRLLAALSSPLAKRIYVVLLVVLVIFLWANMVRRALKHTSSQYDDFVQFSRDLVYGSVNVYEEYARDNTITKYPPFFGLLFAPLVPLPPAIGASFFFLLNLSLSIGATWLSVETIREKLDGAALGKAFYILPFVLTAGIIGSNLETAQVNIIIVFCLILALYTFRRGADLTAGIVLAFITALKLTPGLFIAYFVYKRAWKVVAGAVAGLTFFWFVVSPAVFGLDNYLEIMRSWYGILNPFVTQGTIAEGVQGFRDTNQSMSAVLHRFFTHTPAGGGRPDFYINVLALGYVTMDRIVKVLILGIVAFLIWICRSPIDDRSRIELSLEYSLVMIAMLFISPISWINHYVVLLFPYAAAVYYVRTRPPAERGRQLLLYGPIASFVLVSSSASRLMQAFSIPWLGALLLAVALAVVLRGQGEQPAPTLAAVD